MKTINTLAFALLFAASVSAADVNPADQVKAAIANLKTAANYSWTTTQQIPDMPFTPAPTKGKSDKDGFASVSQEMGDNKLETILKGDKIALKNQEGQWQLIDEADGMAAMMAGWATMYGTAAGEAAKLVEDVKALTVGESNVVSGELTADGAKSLMTFRPRGANAEPPPPTPKNARGSVKFWLKDGALVKFESHIQVTLNIGDQGDQDMNITRTTEIQDVGTTKLEVPAEAKAKLEPKADSTKP